MQLVNLTPHDLNIHTGNGIVDVPPSGVVARVSVVNVDVGYANGIPLRAARFGDVQGLPAPAKGVLYIVSGIVRDRVHYRSDVASPGALVRNDAGQPIGCDGLVINERVTRWRSFALK